MHLEDALADAQERCTCRCTLKMHIKDAFADALADAPRRCTCRCTRKMHLQMHIKDAH
jgi:hypothetical protein